MCRVVFDGVSPSGLIWMLVMAGGACIVAFRGWFRWAAYSDQLLTTYRRHIVWERHPTEMLVIAKLFARYAVPLVALGLMFEIIRLFTGCTLDLFLCGTALEVGQVAGFLMSSVVSIALARHLYLAWFDWERLKDFLEKTTGPGIIFRRGPGYWNATKWTTRLLMPLHLIAFSSVSIGMIGACLFQ